MAQTGTGKKNKHMEGHQRNSFRAGFFLKRTTTSGVKPVIEVSCSQGCDYEEHAAGIWR
jgi:hypothetical protein